MTAAAGAARAGARGPRPSRASATPTAAAGPRTRSPTTRPPTTRPLLSLRLAPVGSRRPTSRSPNAGPERPSCRRLPGVAQVRPEECGREGAGPPGGGGALWGRGQNREFREERIFCSCQGSSRVTGLLHRLRDCEPSSSLRVSATGRTRRKPQSAPILTGFSIQNFAPRSRGATSRSRALTRLSQIWWKVICFSPNIPTHLLPLEAIRNSIVEGFTGTQTSGQHCEVLFRGPFTDKETDADGSPLPSPSPSTSSHSLLIDSIVYT